jgi:hypothetical protein
LNSPSQHVSAGQKILNFLTHTTEKLLPTLAIITDHIIKVGLPLLDGVIMKAVPGSGGVLIKTIVDSAGGMATDLIQKKMAETHLTEEQSIIASTVGQGLKVLTPLVGNVIAEKGGAQGKEIAKVLNTASSDIASDIHAITAVVQQPVVLQPLANAAVVVDISDVQVAGDQAVVHVDHV